MSPTFAFSGSCLCGGIAYAFSHTRGPVVHCHCSMCRKATGAAFRTRVGVPASALAWKAGEDLLRRYASSPGEERSFCGRCGATLFTFFEKHPQVLGLALGTLDAHPALRPVAHVYVGSKARWHEITDDLPQFDAGLPADFTGSSSP